MRFKLTSSNKLSYLSIRQLIELILYGYYPLPKENEASFRNPIKLNLNTMPEVKAVKSKLIALLLDGKIHAFGRKATGIVEKTIAKETLYTTEFDYSCDNYEDEHSMIPNDFWSYDYTDWDESSNYLINQTSYKEIVFLIKDIEYLKNEGLDEIKCSHFKVCGGCDMQHLNKDEYFKAKFSVAENILKSLKLQHILQDKDIIIIGPFSRRRASFKVHEGKIGFYEKQSHNVITITDCVILEPKVFTLYKKLKEIKYLDIVEEISILNSDSGVDVFVKCKKQPKENMLTSLTEFAIQHKITRLATNYQLLIAGQILLEAANVDVELPTEPFLQATKKSEKILVDLVFDATKKSKYVADLFAGCGTYGFNLHTRARVDLYESSNKMYEATTKACVKYTKCSSFMRDLFKHPLTAKELNDYDTVIINPPRAGAIRQIKEIAASKVKNVVMVSCNSETFIKDAAILIEKGYKLNIFKVIDQFFYTNHLEVFANFVL